MADIAPVGLGVQVPTPANPLDIAGKFAAFQNAANQNRLFQSEFAARNALGKAISESTSPEGQLDLDKLQAAIATPGNPAGFKGLEVANTIMQRRLTEAEIQKTQLEMGMKHDELLLNALAPLITKGNSIQRADVLSSASQLVARLQAEGVQGGIASFKSMAKAISAAPESGPALYDWLTNIVQQTESSRKTLEAALGQYQHINAGGADVTVRQPLVGTPYQVGATPMTQTPGELNSTVTGKGPLGQDITISRAGAGMNAPGTVPSFQPTPQPGAEPPSTPPTAVPSTNVPPAPSARAVSSGPGEASAPPSAGVGFTGPDATTSKALEGQGENVKNYEKKLVETVAGGNQQMFQIKKIQGLMEKAYLGGGAEVYQQLAQVAQAVPTSWFNGKTEEERYHNQQSWVDAIAGGGKDALPASQELAKLFVKNATQALRSDFEATGGRVAVDEWKTYQKNNPQINVDPRAVEDMLNFFVKSYNMTKQELGEWNKFKTQAIRSRKPIDLTKFQEEWQSKLQNSGLIQTEEKSGYSKDLKSKDKRPPLESFFK